MCSENNKGNSWMEEIMEIVEEFWHDVYKMVGEALRELEEQNGD